MEEKNKLIADMQAYITESQGEEKAPAKVIAHLIKKYCPKMEMSMEEISSFSTLLANLSKAETEDVKQQLAYSPEFIDVMAKAKHALSVIVYKETRCSDKTCLLEQQLLDIRESLRLDEFDITDDVRLDEEAMASHPTYRNIKNDYYEYEQLEQMFGSDRTSLDSAIKACERSGAVITRDPNQPLRYKYDVEYEKAVVARMAVISEMQKGGKK